MHYIRLKSAFMRLPIFELLRRSLNYYRQEHRGLGELDLRKTIADGFDFNFAKTRFSTGVPIERQLVIDAGAFSHTALG